MLSYIGWLRGWISFQKSEKDFQQKGISKGVWIILEWIWGKSCSWLPENEKNIGYRIFRSQKQNINIKSILNDIRLPRIDFYENTRGKVKKLYLWMVLAHRLHEVDMDRWKHHWLYFWMPAYKTNMFWKHNMKYWGFGMNAIFPNFQ